MTRQLSYFISPPPTQVEHVLREAAQSEPVAARLQQHGPGALLLVELLQLVLGTSDALLPMRLVGQWSTLADLAHANPHDLVRIDGMTPARLARLRAALELAERKQTPIVRTRASSPEDLAAWLMPKLSGLTQEQFWVVLLDTKLRIVSGQMVYQGSVNQTTIRCAEVFADAIRTNAPSIAIAHNHPSSDPTPSPEDVAVTRILLDAGKLLDIDVIDHLVIGNPRYVSLKSQGLAFVE